MTATASAPPTGLSYQSMTGSSPVKIGAGVCHYIKVSSSAGLTIKLWDNPSSASGPVILNTMAVNAGEEHYIPAAFVTGLVVEFVAGTGALTVFFI